VEFVRFCRQESVALVNHLVCFFIGLLFLSRTFSDADPKSIVLGWSLVLFIFFTALWCGKASFWLSSLSA
jgi:hypothetical protein